MGGLHGGKEEYGQHQLLGRGQVKTQILLQNKLFFKKIGRFSPHKSLKIVNNPRPLTTMI